MPEHAVCYELIATDPTGARAGILHTPHGDVPTPVFMPVGTQGTVKMLTVEHLADAGARMILGNTYHLMLRPGADVVADVGGLHRFMAWDGPILTDSGGFQVFSLSELSRISDDGVAFRSHIDGSPFVMTPEGSIATQEKLGADVIMAFDDCPPFPWRPERLRAAVDRTIRWAKRSKRAHRRPDQGLFGIVQGGVDPALRRECAEALVEMDFAGYAVGGVSVGEGPERLREGIATSVPHLPEGKARYLMGVGPPEDLLDGVAAGIDMFDCVIPTRNARNAGAFTARGKLRMRNAAHTRDTRPLEEGCTCLACRRYTRAAIRHWFTCNEATAATLVSIHNIHLLTRLMEQARQAILTGRFASFREQWLARYFEEEG